MNEYHSLHTKETEEQNKLPTGHSYFIQLVIEILNRFCERKIQDNFIFRKCI